MRSLAKFRRITFTQCLAEIGNRCARLSNILATEFGENPAIAGGCLPQAVEYLASYNSFRHAVRLLPQLGLVSQ